MGRLIGIDYGQKRVGIAVTDPDQIIANGLTTVGSHEVFIFLKDYIEKEEVDGFVVGFPRQMNYSLSQSAPFVSAFITGLKRKFPAVPVFEVDERFTSKMAFQTMIDGGLKKKARQNKAMVDKISAVLILQSFMEYRISKERNKDIEL
ncbi:MAG: Holliday junction resolvase RuvX [Bacteroidales bacterium]|nr:Holliday junction resolvase RuvX [Bacteroidales bacterium]